MAHLSARLRFLTLASTTVFRSPILSAADMKQAAVADLGQGIGVWNAKPDGSSAQTGLGAQTAA